MRFTQNQFAKKRTKNHPTVVVGGANASHTLGDFFKINSPKNAQKTMSVWWLGVRKSSLHGDSPKTNHPTVVIGGANADFLLIFKPHTLGDFLKINSPKNAQKIMSVWWLGVRKSSLHGSSPKKNHPNVVIGGASANFLFIFKPHTLGDFVKINSPKNAKKIIPLWWLGVRANLFPTYFLKKVLKKSPKKCIISQNT